MGGQHEHGHRAERCDWQFATTWKSLHFSLGLVTFFKVVWGIACLREHCLLGLIEGKYNKFMWLLGW